MYIEELDTFARGLRGLTFTHALAECIGCRHSPGEIAKWWQRKHPASPWDKRSQMVRLRAGANIERKVLAELCGVSVELADLYDSALWLTVTNLPSARACDELLDTVTVGGNRLDSKIGTFSELLLSRVDLQCLPINLALLYSSHFSYGVYRRLLIKNFTYMYAWYSVQYPFAWISHQLYERLGVYLDQAGGPQPRSWDRWQSILEDCSAQLDDMGSWGWLGGNSACLAMLVWNLSDKGRWSLDDCLRINMGDWPVPMPVATKREWRRRRAVWTDNPVSVNGKECPTPDVGTGLEQLSAKGLYQLRVISHADPADNF